MKIKLILTGLMVTVICIAGVLCFPGKADCSSAGDIRINHKKMECPYMDINGTIVNRTHIHIHNLSLSNNVVLGDIYVFDNSGIPGSYAVYSGLNGTVISPLGSQSLRVDDTGIAPWTMYDGRAPFTAVITWQGGTDDVGLAGTITMYDANGTPVGYKNAETF